VTIAPGSASWLAILLAPALVFAEARAEAPAPNVIAAGGAPAKLSAVVPADDVRRAIVLGTSGEVYEPDGNGAWVHRLPSRTAQPVVAAGRAGASIVALSERRLFRLAANGWSAIRLAQRGTPILGTGRRALAAVGRQLFALDSLTKGEPTRLVAAPGNIIAIGAGATAIVIATEAGAWKLGGAGGRLVPLPAASRPMRLVGDRWALVDRGAVDLTTGKLTAWPSGLAIGVAAATADDALAAIGAGSAGLELVTLRRGTLTRDPLGISGVAVGVVVDRARRAMVALADGRLALRQPAGWSTIDVTDEPAAVHRGAPPAISN